jgi:hypothetical protein
MMKQSHAKTRGLQVVDAMGQILVGKPLLALQFHNDLFFNHEIGQIFAYLPAFVANRK